MALPQSQRLSKEKVLAAARALEQVGKRARVFFSMPVIEGVTPRSLIDSPTSLIWETDEHLPRRHGLFRMDEVGLSCFDHVALYGDACFEGILVPNGRIFLYKEHMWRLWRSAARLNIHIPYSQEELAWEVLQTTKAVGYAEGETGYIRLVASRGLGDLGINPGKCVGATVFSLSSTISLYPREKYEQGIPLGVSRQIRRPDEQVLDPTVKSNNYINNILALFDGTQGTNYMECLVLTRDGYIAEATVDNIFSVQCQPGWEKDPSRVIVSTPRARYCLNGITRSLVIHMAQQRGYRVDMNADLLPLDLVGPDRECFMTGTGAGVMPIIDVAGLQVGNGKPGPVSSLLIEDVRAAMASPDQGIRLEASREEMRDYLATPSLLGDALPMDLASYGETAPASVGS